MDDTRSPLAVCDSAYSAYSVNVNKCIATERERCAGGGLCTEDSCYDGDIDPIDIDTIDFDYDEDEDGPATGSTDFHDEEPIDRVRTVRELLRSLVTHVRPYYEATTMPRISAEHEGLEREQRCLAADLTSLSHMVRSVQNYDGDRLDRRPAQMGVVKEARFMVHDQLVDVMACLVIVDTSSCCPDDVKRAVADLIGDAFEAVADHLRCCVAHVAVQERKVRLARWHHCQLQDERQRVMDERCA